MALLRRYLQVFRGLKPFDVFKEDSLSPKKITLQIIILQLFYYFTATLLFYGWGTFLGYKVELIKWLFSWEAVEFTNSVGLSISMLWLLDALLCVVFLTVIVGRSKLAWDFAITIHAINFIVVFSYTKKMPSLNWFVLQGLSSLILIFLGTYTSRWKELRETFFDGLLDSSDHLIDANEIRSSFSNPPIEMRNVENQV